MTEKQPMQREEDLDYSTLRCPCGATAHGSNPDWDEWVEKHRPHTNGKIVSHCTTNGARVYGGVAPPDHEETL